MIKKIVFLSMFMFFVSHADFISKWQEMKEWWHFFTRDNTKLTKQQMDDIAVAEAEYDKDFKMWMRKAGLSEADAEKTIEKSRKSKESFKQILRYPCRNCHHDTRFSDIPRLLFEDSCKKYDIHPHAITVKITELPNNKIMEACRHDDKPSLFIDQKKLLSINQIELSSQFDQKL